MANAEHLAPSIGEAIDRLRAKWAAIAAFGVLLVLLGVAAVAFSVSATIATVTLNIGAGLICIANPTLASVVLTLLLGAGLIAAGLVRLVLGLQLPRAEPRGLVLLAGAVTILLGLVMVAHWPLDSVYVLGTLLGVDLLLHVAGWVAFGVGLQSRA